MLIHSYGSNEAWSTERKLRLGKKVCWHQQCYESLKNLQYFMHLAPIGPVVFVVFFFSFLFAIFPLEVSRLYGCPGVRSWKLDFCIWKRNIQVFWWWGTREPLMLCGHLSETFLWSTFDLYVIIFIFSITTG